MRWLFLFIGFPVLELIVLIRVGSLIGPGLVIGALILAAVIGTLIIRMAGENNLNKMRDDLGARKVPERDLLSGVLLFLSGLFFILPGFISDFIGLLLLIPITRAYAAQSIINYLRNRQNAMGQTYSQTGSNGARFFFYSSRGGFQSPTGRDYGRDSSEYTVIDCDPADPAAKQKGPDSPKESDPDIIDCDFTEVPPKGLPKDDK